MAKSAEFLRKRGLHPFPLLQTLREYSMRKAVADLRAGINVAQLESYSIAKTLAAQSGDRVDLNQQMLSMGAANFACAFGSGMAVSGSLTRSVLNFKTYHAENPNISTRDALKRAQAITGSESADITIYAREKEGKV